LNRRFGAAMGLPPHRYHLQLRIDAAKRKLAAGESIVQVAIDLGFSDQSHFTRLFSRVVGATPAQYQKQR
jgi:AraC-like DNA-binding protein